ncbi:MAG: response regulator transcription factor [Spirochaetaceae bacterium]|jgi:DNA-binding response OmpR family regulator|nr:response regulator transcription factor [Spirochaetaceae bacterium]
MENNKPRILIIEDDADIAAIERDFLEIAGFEVAIEKDGTKGAEQALAGGFALILLDLMLPGRDGMTICREIRAKLDVPILMVTARGEDLDKVRGLGLGADDYVTKPFSPTELVARVKSHIARYERLTKAPVSHPGDVDLGWLTITQATHRVFVREIEVALTNKEYELLSFLAANPERVFTKEQIYEKIWGQDRYGDIKTVAVHVSRLREKIETDPAEPGHLQTLWGAGYRFVP